MSGAIGCVAGHHDLNPWPQRIVSSVPLCLLMQTLPLLYLVFVWLGLGRTGFLLIKVATLLPTSCTYCFTDRSHFLDGDTFAWGCFSLNFKNGCLVPVWSRHTKWLVVWGIHWFLKEFNGIICLWSFPFSGTCFCALAGENDQCWRAYYIGQCREVAALTMRHL